MNKEEFTRWARAESYVAWKANKKKIEERLGNTRINFAVWKLLEKTHEVGFYSGIEAKIRYGTIEELADIEPPGKKV